MTKQSPVRSVGRCVTANRAKKNAHRTDFAKRDSDKLGFIVPFSNGCWSIRWHQSDWYGVGSNIWMTLLQCAIFALNHISTWQLTLCNQQPALMGSFSMAIWCILGVHAQLAHVLQQPFGKLWKMRLEKTHFSCLFFFIFFSFLFVVCRHSKCVHWWHFGWNVLSDFELCFTFETNSQEFWRNYEKKFKKNFGTKYFDE